jgi:tRNA nucleotidyltransferase (CCA-adding enzyme)
MELSIPWPVLKIIEELQSAGYEAYAAGEVVRDSLIGLDPQELRVATDAPPEMADALFDRVYPSGDDDRSVVVWDEQVPVKIELSCLRDWFQPGSELPCYPTYCDFTVNSIFYNPFSRQLIDPWQVSSSLNSGEGIIQAVGNPASRFKEDPIRLLKVFYLMKRFDDAGLKWRFEQGTWDALVMCSSAISAVSKGEVGEYLNRIIVGSQPDIYLERMRSSGVLQHILPELAETYGIEEHGYLIKDVFDHTKLVVREISPELHLRWAALLHDIGKPHCISFQKDRVHFYGHQVISSVISRRILRRLKFSRGFIERVSFLVYHHMFPTPRTSKAVRRFVTKIGLKNLGDLLELRRADIIGGKYKNIGNLNRLKKELNSVLFTPPPFSLKNLEVDGYDVMKVLGMKPGPMVGDILQGLFERVKENPELNERETLLRILQDEFQPVSGVDRC